MQWAAATHGPEGKVLADGRTLEYIGRGQHARDAMCVRSNRPASSLPYIHHHQHHRATASSSAAAAATTTTQPHFDAHSMQDAKPPATLPRAAHDRTHRPHSSSDTALSALRLFYFETLIVSTCGDDDSRSTSDSGNGNGSASDSAAALPLDARAELDLLMARVNGLARSSSSSQRPTSPPLASATASSTNSATVAHPHADTRTGSARLTWRARARRIVHANLLAAEPLLHPASSNGGNSASDATSTRMELDDDSTRSSNGDGAFARAIDQASVAARDRSTTTMRHRTSGATTSRGGATDASDRRGATDAPSVLSSSTLHFAFTLSSRTLQQIRSRHERRRARRHEALKRFNHRIAVGFAFTPSTAMSESGASSDRECWFNHSATLANSAAASREDLGADAHSLAYEGKTGRIVSNGHVFLQCERYGVDDVVGCGLLFDTQTFFFTLNGRLLGLLAATDVHHWDTLVDRDDTVRSRTVKPMVTSTHANRDAATDSDDDTGAFEPDDSGSSDTDEDNHSLDTAAAFDDVVYPAVSLHSTGECVSAAFETFQFDLAAFAQQIQKERQLALVLHETADERDGGATDDVLHDLVLEYFSHYGYENAYQAFGATNSSGRGGSRRSSKAMDIDSDEHKASEPSATALLHVRHCVRQHVYAHETAQALNAVLAALGHDFFTVAAATARGATVLFYMRVLCVLDVLLGPTAGQSLNASRNDASAASPISSNNWRVEDAIVCAQELFASDAMSIGPSPTSALVADTELPLVLTLLLYEREADVPVDCAARKFLTPAFREHVADELNLLVFAHAAPCDQPRRKISNRPASAALQQFLEERQALETQCLQSGCRVFPGNHTVSSIRTRAASRKASRHHHNRHRLSVSSSSEAGGNDDDYDDDDDDDEHMGSSSSGSDVSSSSSRSEHDGTGEHDDDDDAMDEDGN